MSESVRQVIRTLLESFFVDDCLTSLPCTKDADVFKETSIALMANAGMELRKWRGNSIASNDNTADEALGICRELPSVGEQKSGKKILLRSTHFQHAVGSGLIQKVCTTYTCSVMHQK